MCSGTNFGGQESAQESVHGGDAENVPDEPVGERVQVQVQKELVDVSVGTPVPEQLD